MTAPAFAFLHGGGQGSWVWNETIAALAAQSGGAARTLALDAPGCGTKQARETGEIGLLDIVDELASDIAAAGFAGATLVGHSQAGTILPLIVARHPALVAQLVYVTCSAPLPGESMLTFRSSLPETPSILDGPFPNTRERYGRLFCNDMAPAATEDFLDRLGPDGWPRASYAAHDWRYDHLVGLPSTYVVCLRDQALPPDWQAIFAERLHAATVRIDAGHQPMNTRPQALAELLLAIG